MLLSVVGGMARNSQTYERRQGVLVRVFNDREHEEGAAALRGRGEHSSDKAKQFD